MNLPSPRLTPAFRRFSNLLAAVAVGHAVLFAAPEVSAQTGAAEGRVQNAVSGAALNLAQVEVVGTSRTTTTNEFGDYYLPNLPVGEVTLRASYTGLEARTMTVTIAAGQTTSQEFSLASARRADAVKEGELVVMDAFTVASERDTNAASIAANEQRYAPNLKTVISSDAFGDVTEGNVGEFAKFLPGVTVDYVAADVRTMAVRGFADSFTSVTVNGDKMASAASGASTRAFEFEQVSINNVARLEVTKTPIPSMPADSLGGAVNLVSKNAFESKKASFKYRTYLSVNSENLKLPFAKSAGPGNRPQEKTLPGMDFTYTVPLSKTFGFVLTGLYSSQFNEQHRSQNLWNSNIVGATHTNPFLQTYLFQDGPKFTTRSSISFKADWKITPGQILSASVQNNYYHSDFYNRNYQYETHTSTTTGQPTAWSPTMTDGALGRGRVRGATSFRDKYGATTGGDLKYSNKGRDWEFNASLNASKSKTWYRDTARGHFSNVGTTMVGVSRVVLDNIDGDRPQIIRVLSSTGVELNPNLLSNFNLDSVRSQPIDASDEFVGGSASIKRQLDFLSFPTSLKAGAGVVKQTRDIRRYDTTWLYNGIITGGTLNKNAGFALDQGYLNQDPGFGLTAPQWVDPYFLYDFFRRNPDNFSVNDAAAERYRLQNSQYIEETITHAYLQADTKLFRGRLTLVGGVRFEKTQDNGLGVISSGAGDTVAALRADWVERGAVANKSYSDYYPSINASIILHENLLLRLAYAETLGRPDFGNILPLTRVNSEPTSINDGIGNLEAQTVRVNNTGLLPWGSKGYDISLEYYLPKGGIVSAGWFYKDLSNFWGEEPRPLTAADIAAYQLDPGLLDPAIGGMTIRSKINVGKASISGAEFNYQQPLVFLPGFGQNFNVFANGTLLNLKGPNSVDFEKFIDRSASWGITYSAKPVVLSIKWNYRGKQNLLRQVGNQYGPNAAQLTAAEAAGVPYDYFREFYRPRTFTDINAEYQFNKRFTVFLNARNIFNVQQVLQRYNSVTPDYARNYRYEEFGVQFSMGVKGTF